jgi:hypothetical protein
MSNPRFFQLHSPSAVRLRFGGKIQHKPLALACAAFECLDVPDIRYDVEQAPLRMRRCARVILVMSGARRCK